MLMPLVIVAHLGKFSMDSYLEAFNRNPTDGSFEALAFRLAAFTDHVNAVFLSC